MPPAIVTATIQATVLSFASCFVAMYLSSSKPPFFALITFTLLSTPPNFLWQQYIETKFPGYYTRRIEVDDDGKGAKVEKKLNVRNTSAKFLLDQTVAALVNVVTFLGGVRLLNGESMEVCWHVVKEETWPVMLAGYKLWPLVNLVQHTLIPVNQKTLVGSLVGFGWGIFLALRTASRDTKG